MAQPLPQADLPRGLSGGADAWDIPTAGLLLGQDYFDAAPAAATGDLAAQESGADSAAIAGRVPVRGEASAQEGTGDAFAATGTVSFAPRTGTLAAVEDGNDTATILAPSRPAPVAEGGWTRLSPERPTPRVRPRREYPERVFSPEPPPVQADAGPVQAAPARAPEPPLPAPLFIDMSTVSRETMPLLLAPSAQAQAARREREEEELAIALLLGLAA